MLYPSIHCVLQLQSSGEKKEEKKIAASHLCQTHIIVFFSLLSILVIQGNTRQHIWIVLLCAPQFCGQLKEKWLYCGLLHVFSAEKCNEETEMIKKQRSKTVTRSPC